MRTTKSDQLDNGAGENVPPVIVYSVFAGLALVALLVLFNSPLFKPQQSEPVRVGELMSFDGEARRATKALSCPRPVFTHDGLYPGTLYGCIMGEADTAKYFIDEDPDKRGTVMLIKLIWNDWYRDLGFGVHPDKAEAELMVRSLARFFAPDQEAEMIAAFRGTAARTFNASGVTISYTWDRGSAIDAHMFVVLPR